MFNWLSYIIFIWLIFQPVSCEENVLKAGKASVQTETEESFDDLVQYNHFPID
ncbi:MAG: hypothetical protein JNK08_11295 [Sediminibacterium sp.]|nr:hypothetical protein [Sediminibacterium sp.]